MWYAGNLLMSKTDPKPKLEKERPPRGFSGDQKEFEREVQGKKTTSAEQLKAFRDAARELECDDGEKAFDKVLRKIASAPPPKSVQRRKTVAPKSKPSERKR